MTRTSFARSASKFSTTIANIAAMPTTGPAPSCLGNQMQIDNLTPNHFPSGKVSKNEEVSVALGLCSPFPHRKGGEGDRTAPDSDNSSSPSHYGKGLGVRLYESFVTRATTERGLNTEKRGLGVRLYGSSAHSGRRYSQQSGSPSHYGKGLGVRFLLRSPSFVVIQSRRGEESRLHSSPLSFGRASRN